ncbi:hypothetical protein PROFUN_02123 [Planoprotostelium fungivorum]|uniref:Helicase-associated domain-containing protein n=1 Tax=Planoprotostelium fungivorum TaxID=1890364 RepID=A0A2P6NZ99_9EUKA|nr:hypothetical protein PROFUN_02123 [Planoprotostelium fungivorum]
MSFGLKFSTRHEETLETSVRGAELGLSMDSSYYRGNVYSQPEYDSMKKIVTLANAFQGEEFFDFKEELPQAKRMKVPVGFEAMQQATYSIFLESLHDVDWDAALTAAIFQDQNPDGWMIHYERLRKSVSCGERLSFEDAQWLSKQLDESRGDKLTPERSELLRQTIEAMTQNTKVDPFAPLEFQDICIPNPLFSSSSDPSSPMSVSFLPLKEPTPTIPQHPPSQPTPCYSQPQSTTTTTRKRRASESDGDGAPRHALKRNQLASWMCTQRQDKKSGELPEYRIKLLDLLDFAWTKHHKKRQGRDDEMMDQELRRSERTVLNSPEVLSFTGRAKKNHDLWMVRFHELVKFKEKNGHLKVPTHIPDVTE